ncbi:MAG: mercury(II) reductase [bacterium]
MSDCCSPASENRFDLIVIGAGSAGFSAAITAAEKGKNIAIIGYGPIGGTCVNVGCVPSKTMIRAAQALYSSQHAKRFEGITSTASVSNWSALQAQKQQLVEELRHAKYVDILPQYSNITYIEGQAILIPDGVQVADKKYFSSKIIIATGSQPMIPPIDGILSVPYLDSTSALELAEIPNSLMIIGGGVIGCELGQMFSRMGSKVTLLCRSTILKGAEPEISEALLHYFRSEGMNVRCGVRFNKVERTKQGIELSYTQDGHTQHLTAEKLLLATGRSANVKGLGVEEAGIVLAKNGGILTNEFMQTSIPHIYAAGDVTGRDLLVYMAAYGAKIAAHNALYGNEKKYDNSIMPEVVFTDPNYASVGFTQAEAQANGLDTKISVLDLKHVPRALAARDMRGLIKLVAEASTGRLLGAHVLAPEGADIIQTAALAIKSNMTFTELGEMIFPYLTTVEGLKLAAQTFDKDVSKLSCCAG